MVPPPRRAQRLAMDLSLSWGSRMSSCDAQAGGASGTPCLLSGAGSLPSQGQRLAVQVALPSPPPRTEGGGALASLTLARLLISS